ncbi:unnamed protein product [Boreogadus saida]
MLLGHLGCLARCVISQLTLGDEVKAGGGRSWTREDILFHTNLSLCLWTAGSFSYVSLIAEHLTTSRNHQAVTHTLDHLTTSLTLTLDLISCPRDPTLAIALASL